jgi:hypothetical protein
MKAEDFDSLRKAAGELFAQQSARGDKNKVSLDAIFTSLAVAHEVALKTGRQKSAKQEAAPEWFTKTFKQLKGKGEAITVSRFLMLAGRFPATRPDALNVGRWLREAGIEPQKVGGNLLFKL